jgi:hypothetical protein
VISGIPTASGETGFTVNLASSQAPGATVSRALSLSVLSAAPWAVQKPKLKLTLTRSSTRAGRAILVLSCSGGPCAGVIIATGVEHLRGRTPASVSAHARASGRTRMVTLLSGRYSLAAGRTKVLTLKLWARAARLLRTLHRVSGYLRITPKGADKPALITKLTFTASRRR